MLENKQVKIYGKLVNIKAYTPEPQCTVRLSGLAESTTKDLLELYFENEQKSSGGDVKDIQLDEEESVAFVTFETEEGKLFILSDCLNKQKQSYLIVLTEDGKLHICLNKYEKTSY